MNNVDYLRQAAGRLSSLQLNNPDSTEFTRFQDVIIPDLMSKLTTAERIEYDQLTAGKTAEQIKKESAEAIRQMNENKDKPSI